MTNNESRDFVSIFSGKGLISSTIMINCSEFAKLTMRFHLLAAAQMGPLACTLPYKAGTIHLEVAQEQTRFVKNKVNNIKSI